MVIVRLGSFSFPDSSDYTFLSVSLQCLNYLFMVFYLYFSSVYIFTRILLYDKCSLEILRKVTCYVYELYSFVHVVTPGQHS